MPWPGWASLKKYEHTLHRENAPWQLRHFSQPACLVQGTGCKLSDGVRDQRRLLRRLVDGLLIPLFGLPLQVGCTPGAIPYPTAMRQRPNLTHWRAEGFPYPATLKLPFR